MANNFCAPSLNPFPQLYHQLCRHLSLLSLLLLQLLRGLKGSHLAQRISPSQSLPLPAEEFPKPIFLMLPAGIDIITAIITFARNQDACILVHHASGTISQVNLCNPVFPFDDLSFQGNMYMFSFLGFYAKSLSPLPPKNIPFSFFNIRLSKGTTPQHLGGLIRGKLIAAEPVHVMASLLKEHEYQQVGYPVITNPNVQPVINSTRGNRYASIMSNAINGITNNT